MPPKKKGDKEKAAPAAKKGAPIPTRDQRVAALHDMVNKKYKGRAQLKLASEYVLPFMTKRMPTGLLLLDVALGGGFPCGGVSQIVGAKNAGKTYLIWQVIRQQQFMKGNKLKVLLAMTEMRADRTQAKRGGVAISLGDADIHELERARISQGLPKFSKEELVELKREIGAIDEVHGESAEVLFDIILKAVEENAYHIIIIDSFGSIMSAAEAENESLEDKTFAGASKPITEFLRKLSSMLTMDDAYGVVRDVCIIGINQIRDAIGQPNLEYRSTGGRALEHAKLVDLFLSSGAAIKYEDSVYTVNGMKKRTIVTGKEVHWRIVKGKAGIHEGASGSFNFDFASATGDFYSDTLAAGVRYEVIEHSGSWLGVPNPNEPGKYLLRENSREAFIDALAKDAAQCAAEGSVDSVMNYIRAEVFKKNNIHINFE